MLQQLYTNKQQLIKDILKICRTTKKSYIFTKTGTNYDYYSKQIAINHNNTIEYWNIHLYVSNKKVETSFTVFVPSFNIQTNETQLKPIHYPLTNWTNTTYGHRWDSDLKEFLEREILKDVV